MVHWLVVLVVGAELLLHRLVVVVVAVVGVLRAHGGLLPTSA